MWRRTWKTCLYVKYTLLSSKKFWFQDFKEYFAHLAYFNAHVQYFFKVIKNVNTIVIYSYWTWKAENPPYECTWFRGKMKHVGKQKKLSKELARFNEKITNLIVVRRQIYLSVINILKYGHFNYTFLNIFC
jgi:hypothetical protein